MFIHDSGIITKETEGKVRYTYINKNIALILIKNIFNKKLGFTIDSKII